MAAIVEEFELPNAEDDSSFIIQQKVLDVWSDGETRLLLEKYSEYLPLIGPMKRFKLKKHMWAQIGADLISALACFKTAQQCESRYKTVMKRKRCSVKNNRTSGAKREKIEFEQEISRICELDDSIEPEILISTQNVLAKKSPKKSKVSGSSEDNMIDNNIAGTSRKNITKPTDVEKLLEIINKKEIARERRHNEKMEAIQKLTAAVGKLIEK